jgi:hypothetical protein
MWLITFYVHILQAKGSSTPQLGASAVREYHWGLPSTVANI